MTKNVMLSMRGLHENTNQEADSPESLVPGEYFLKNGSHYLFFTEKGEDGGLTKSRIKFRKGYLELVRQGELDARMIFEAQKKHTTEYRTPFGSIAMEIETQAIEMEEKEKRIQVRIAYRLKMDGQPASKSRLVLDIRAEDYFRGFAPAFS